MTGPTVRARLLGAFEVTIDGIAVDRAAFERPSGLRLLKLLLTLPAHRVRREEAAELLWPEADPDRSGANLRKAIHFARRALEGSGPGAGGLVVADGDWLRLGPAATFDIDLDELDAALDRLEHVDDAADARDPRDSLAALARLGREDLLPEDPYEEWLVALRERLRQRTQSGLVAGGWLARRLGDRRLAFELVDRALAMDPADEQAHRLAIELHLDADHLHAARRQLRACELAVAEAFGVQPNPDLGKLIEVAATRRAAAPLAPAAELPIIGRRLELEAIEVALDRVAAGTGAAALVHGPAGIGKTRVLRDMVQSARASGWRVVEARGLEAAPDTAFAELGRAFVAALGGALPADLREPWRSAIATVVPDLAERPTLTFASDAALVAGLVGVALRIAADGPTTIAVDDVQWLDGPSLLLLDRIVAATPGQALLLLLALRDEPGRPEPALATLIDDVRRAGGPDVALGPLAPREVRVLVERELAGAHLDDGLAASIAGLSGGAPLFALELFRGARDIGTIEQRDGRWRLRPGASLSIPESVARLVERRVARVPAGPRAILGTAAELGDAVGFEELVAATGTGGGEILDALDAAIAAGILVESGGRYRFGHPLFRAAIRRGVAARARGDLHQRVATTLARGVDPTDRAAIEQAGAGIDLVAVAANAASAVELGRAEATPLAVGFGLAAGSRQARLFDLVAAAETIERALRAWFRLEAGERARYPASEGQIELGWARHGLGDERAAAEAFRAAAMLGRDDAERVRAYAAAAWMPYQHGRFDRADEILREGLQHVTDRVAIATLESERGWILGRLDRGVEALPILEAAVATLEDAALPGVLARALDRYGVVASESVRMELGPPILERALRLAIEVVDTRLEATIRMHLGGCLGQLGEVDRASRELERAIELTHFSGDRYIEAVCEWNAAQVEQARRRFPAAIAHRRRELEILAQIGGNPQNEAMAHAHLTHMLRRVGDDDGAATEAQAARDIARHAGIDGLAERIEQHLAVDAFGVVLDGGARGGNGAGTPDGEDAPRA
jgi:DNA-binding SARP family transcriptional activator